MLKIPSFCTGVPSAFENHCSITTQLVVLVTFDLLTGVTQNLDNWCSVTARLFVPKTPGFCIGLLPNLENNYSDRSQLRSRFLYWRYP